LFHDQPVAVGPRRLAPEQRCGAQAQPEAAEVIHPPHRRWGGGPPDEVRWWRGTAPAYSPPPCLRHGPPPPPKAPGGFQPPPRPDRIRPQMGMPRARTSRDSSNVRRAIIDIGSNSIRLVVFDGPERLPDVYFNEKVMAGLGRNLARDGVIDAASIDVTLRAL